MSMNKFMHPRNIYKTPPDFKKLAAEYPEFKQHVKLDISGKVLFDFKDPHSLRILSKILLKRDFDLDVEIPLNKLIPTIPLRLNYILWLEDLLKFIGKEGNITGIDIGTGASCVYPLIAAKKNSWTMIATEIDQSSVDCARNNVERNNLNDLIRVIHVNNSDKLIEEVITSDYDFCMCNPPFFSNTQELHPFFKSRKSSRPHPKNAFVATLNEVVADGGEVDFITKLINESKRLKTKVTLYTTMVGHKSSIPALKKLLRDVEVCSFKESEFCQGNTTRWGLAWTFNTEFNLKKYVDTGKLIAIKSTKPPQPFEYVIPLVTEDINESVFDKTNNYLLKLFTKNLQMSCDEVTRNKKVKRYFLTAHANTWSHQRQKKRMRESQGSTLNNNDEDDVESPKSPGKRLHGDESFDGSILKKLKIDDEAGLSYFFKFVFSLTTVDSKLVLSLNNVDADSNREHLHQILQYVKNNFKPEHIV